MTVFITSLETIMGTRNHRMALSLMTQAIINRLPKLKNMLSGKVAKKMPYVWGFALMGEDGANQYSPLTSRIFLPDHPYLKI